MSQSQTQRAPSVATTTDERACPECGGDVHPDDQETVCSECGLVVDVDDLDRGPNWTRSTHDGEGGGRRSGPAQTRARHDNGLSTAIGWDDRDANGNQLSAKKRSQMGRLRTWHKRARFESKRERNLAEALGEIDRMGTALGMGRDRREQACQLYRSAHEANLIVGRCIEALAAAAVYGVGRVHRLTTRLPDVADVARVDRERIAASYRLLNRELGLPAKPPEPVDHVPRICSDLGCADDVRHLAERLADAYGDVYPARAVQASGVAAAAVYVACRRQGAGRSQDDVGDAAGVTGMTVRNRYHELGAVFEEVLHDDG